MKIVKEVTKLEKQTIGFVCDRCGTEINSDKNFHRTDDFQLKYSFGYGTEYDGDRIELDICDYCLVDIVKKEIHNFKFENTEQF